jgi:hypothetical protein
MVVDCLKRCPVCREVDCVCFPSGFDGFEICPVDQHWCSTGPVEGRCCSNREPTVFEWGSAAYGHMEEHLAVRARLTLRRVRFTTQRVQEGGSYGLQYRERLLDGPWWAAIANRFSGVALFFAWYPESPECRWDGYARMRAEKFWTEKLHPPDERRAAEVRAAHDVEG